MRKGGKEPIMQRTPRLAGRNRGRSPQKKGEAELESGGEISSKQGGEKKLELTGA